MQNHYMLQRIPVGRNSEAAWAVHPTGHALVFVHGFRGSATGTWPIFPSMLREESKCAGWDFVFYGYDGAKTRATNSAHFLKEFLDLLFRDPLSIINPALAGKPQRPAGFAYQRIVIVAHSLGAVVGRQALLNAHLDKKTWVPQTALILFAPAHMGASIVSLVTEMVGGFQVGLLAGAAFLLKLRWKVLRDLEPDSKTLQTLLENTKSELRKGNARHLQALRVVHAAGEGVVETVRFAEDPPHEAWEDVSHGGICKPNYEFPEPVRFVVDAI
jgi:pimeloyl-ACP methyl ester carboxylesterase